MKNVLVLLLVLAALGGGIGMWYSLSDRSLPGDTLDGPAAAPGANKKRESAHLEAPALEKQSEIAAREAVTPQAPPTDPKSSEPPAETGQPSDLIKLASIDQDLEVKYSGASLRELRSAHQALDELYRQNLHGDVADKQHLLRGDSLEQLAREVAWLKEKAYGGG